VATTVRGAAATENQGFAVTLNRFFKSHAGLYFVQGPRKRLDLAEAACIPI
jgi:hypothetical protein